MGVQDANLVGSGTSYVPWLENQQEWNQYWLLETEALQRAMWNCWDWHENIGRATSQAIDDGIANPFDPTTMIKMCWRIVDANLAFISGSTDMIYQYNPLEPMSGMAQAMTNWTTGITEMATNLAQNPTNSYHIMQAIEDISAKQRSLAKEFSSFLSSTLWENPFSKHIEAQAHSTEKFLFHRDKPEWDVSVVHPKTNEVEKIVPKKVMDQPFCEIQRFECPKKNAPTVFIVAPVSGHYATLLNETVQELVQENNVCITDWKDARRVPKEIRFGTNDYIKHLIEAWQELKIDNVVTVCQWGPWAITAAAYCENKWLHTPKNMTFMASPIDISQNPTGVNKYADTTNVEELARKVITHVPDTTNWKTNAWAGRRVYPWWLQLLCFMSMNSKSHFEKLKSLHEALLHENEPESKRIIKFYTEYMSVMDLPEELFLETFERIFTNNEAASGEVMYDGEVVYLEDYTGNVMAIEGELDDVCGLWQTAAVLGLTSNAQSHVYHKLQLAGHYWVFAGSMFRLFIVPRINAFIRGENMESFEDSPEALAHLDKKLKEAKKKTH